jgi:hypothetical protein
MCPIYHVHSCCCPMLVFVCCFFPHNTLTFRWCVTGGDRLPCQHHLSLRMGDEQCRNIGCGAVLGLESPFTSLEQRKTRNDPKIRDNLFFEMIEFSKDSLESDRAITVIGARVSRGRSRYQPCPNLRTWIVCFLGFLEMFCAWHAESPLLIQDRLAYMQLIIALCVRFTVASVIEYDKQLRMSRTGVDVEWSKTIDSVLRLRILVPRQVAIDENMCICTDNPQRSARRHSSPGQPPHHPNRKKGGNRGSSKKPVQKCRSAEKGEECSWESQGSCRFSHTCPKCNKSYTHVWKDCK